MTRSLSIVIAAWLLLAAVVPAKAAVMLSNMDHPTVQSLIDAGSTGVMIGTDTFFGFTYSGPNSASAVAVAPITDGGVGLQFISTWQATSGNTNSAVITYKVQAADVSSMFTGANLFSDGTAPLPAAGTYASTVLTVRPSGSFGPAKVLSTYEDGLAAPAAGTSDRNSFYLGFAPLVSISVTDAISNVSSNGGVAATSIVENTFVPVPEPKSASLIALIGILALVGNGRRNRSSQRLIL